MGAYSVAEDVRLVGTAKRPRGGGGGGGIPQSLKEIFSALLMFLMLGPLT